jgi:hypothetical protein
MFPEVWSCGALKLVAGGEGRTEVFETMWFADFGVLEQAEGRVSRGKGAAGEKKWWPAGSKGGERGYTEPSREAQKGNPGSNPLRRPSE